LECPNNRKISFAASQNVVARGSEAADFMAGGDRSTPGTGRQGGRAASQQRADIVAKVEKSGMAKIDVKAGVRGRRRS
jgi:hypothetical protein